MWHYPYGTLYSTENVPLVICKGVDNEQDLGNGAYKR